MMNKKRKCKAQQEMVGFVLIVVLVVVVAMIFLVISTKKPVAEKESTELYNLISALMDQTTECADYEPNYYDMRKLIRSCYQNKRCNNLDKTACEYLNQSLTNIIGDVLKTESQASYYNFNIFYTESSINQTEPIFYLSEDLQDNGELSCTKSIVGAQESIVLGSGKIIARLRFCYS